MTHILKKISASLYLGSLIASIPILFAHSLGLLNLDLILAIRRPTLIIGGQLEDLAYLLERQKPLFYNKYGKISLTLSLLMNLAGLVGGPITLLNPRPNPRSFFNNRRGYWKPNFNKNLKAKQPFATNINSKNVNNACKGDEDKKLIFYRRKVTNGE